MASAQTPWKEHVLEEIPVADGDVGDAVTCLLHTILFTRAPGSVRPSEATCHAFPNISYSLCAVGDVSRKVEHAVKAFEESVMGSAVMGAGTGGARSDMDLETSGRYGSGGGGYGGGGYGQPRSSSFGSSQRLSFGGGAGPVSRSGCLVVAFYHLKKKEALFGLISTEEKIFFEKWIVPVHVSPSPASPTQQDAATRETEMALQNALLHILSAVQTIDHVPSATYYFEVTVDPAQTLMTPASEISPPLASPSSAVARKCRPPFSARPSPRASSISFAASSGRDTGYEVVRQSNSSSNSTTPRSARPWTAGRPGSSHRRLTTGTTTQWQFLTKTTTEEQYPPPQQQQQQQQQKVSGTRPHTARVRSPQQQQQQRPTHARPATARAFSVSTSPSSSSASVPVHPPQGLPKRPATCRGLRSHRVVGAVATTPKPQPQPHAKALVLVDPRVLHEAVRRETEQEVYTGPLLGRSVEMQPPLDQLTHANRDSRVVNAVSLAEFHRAKAFQARAKGDQPRAIAHYEKLLELAPKDHVALFQLAVAYEKMGHLQAARAAYTRVLALARDDATNPFLHYNLGNLFMKMELVDEAIASYSTAIQQGGGAGKCQQLAFYRQRGAAYRKKGDFENAAQDYARVHLVRRRRSSLTTLAATESSSSSSSVVASSGPGVAGSTSADTGDRPEDLVDASKTYSAEPMYAASHFRTQCVSSSVTTAVGSVGSVLDEAMHRQAMEIALRPRRLRSEDDLWFVGDVLQKQFPECAALEPRARKELSARMVACASLARGAMLVDEGTRGGDHIFFIARGRVAIYKQFEPRFGQARELQPSSTVDRPQVVSWEILRATMRGGGPEQEEEDGEEAFQSMVANAKTFPRVDLATWSKDQQVLLTHVAAGGVCGRQGRFSRRERSFSAVVSESCDFFAVSWTDFHEVERIHRDAQSEQAARFLTTVPLFHGICLDELVRVSKRAKNWKVVGARVLCTEGQHVNGLVVVREGHVCQLTPSELARPPNLAVTFSLSGQVSVSGKDRDDGEGGRHFFTQLEHSDDPLLFLHDSARMHGFVPREYLPRMLTKLSTSSSKDPNPQVDEREDTNQQADEREEREDATVVDEEPEHEATSSAMLTAALPPPGATSLARGAFFSASSSWIPPRKSRRDDLASASSSGVACAKSALVSTESCELLFFTASDLTHGMTLASRALLQKNMQHILSMRRRPQSAETANKPPPPLPPRLSTLSRRVFLKQPSGDDLVQKFVYDSEWRHYKQTLVRSIVATKPTPPPPSCNSKSNWRR